MEHGGGMIDFVGALPFAALDEAESLVDRQGGIKRVEKEPEAVFGRRQQGDAQQCEGCAEALALPLGIDDAVAKGGDVVTLQRQAAEPDKS